MEPVGVSELELYHRGGRWRFSVFEIPAARACGAFTALGGEATFEQAEDTLIAHVEATYGFTPSPVWREVESGWWVATIRPSA